MERHSSRRAKLGLNGFNDLGRGLSKRHCGTEKKISRTKIISFGKKLPNNISHMAPHLLGQRAAKEYTFHRLQQIVHGNEDNSYQPPRRFVLAIRSPSSPYG